MPVWRASANELGVHFEASANLASSGVKGGALIILGEDYGEGASIMQERTHAFAMKSQMWLLDPRPHLPTIVRAVEQAFELYEASNTPVMLMLRIRACHVYGHCKTKDNRLAFSPADALAAPERDYSGIIPPPSTYAQVREKIEVRFPAAQRFFTERGLNEINDGEAGDIGIVMQRAFSTTRCARWNCSIAPTRSVPAACRCIFSTSPIRWCPKSGCGSAAASVPS